MANASGSPRTILRISRTKPIEVNREENEHKTEGWVRYTYGGFHPTHLGDKIGPKGSPERYRVVNKLGNGGYASVWLCEDAEYATNRTGRWKAVKINTANASTEHCPELKAQEWLRDAGVTPKNCLDKGIVMASESFWLDGPNGRHFCLVSPVMGSDLRDIAAIVKRTVKDLKNICYQLAKVMWFLHSNGIGHGDFRPENILFQIASIDDLDEIQLMRIMGRPKIISRHGNDAAVENGQQPRYLVCLSNITSSSNLDTNRIAVNDFGAAFRTNNPPNTCCIPEDYRAPEFLLLSEMGCGSDLWSLACTFCELFTCSPGFVRVPYGLLATVIAYWEIAGPLPENYLVWFNWQAVASHPVSEEDNFAYGHRFGPVETLCRIAGFLMNGHSQVFRVPLGPGEERPKNTPSETPKGYKCFQRRPLPKRDAEELADLLHKMFRWLPSDRSTPEAVMDHRLFRDFNKGDTMPAGRGPKRSTRLKPRASPYWRPETSGKETEGARTERH